MAKTVKDDSVPSASPKAWECLMPAIQVTPEAAASMPIEDIKQGLRLMRLDPDAPLPGKLRRLVKGDARYKRSVRISKPKRSAFRLTKPEASIKNSELNLVFRPYLSWVLMAMALLVAILPDIFTISSNRPYAKIASEVLSSIGVSERPKNISSADFGKEFAVFVDRSGSMSEPPDIASQPVKAGAPIIIGYNGHRQFPDVLQFGSDGAMYTWNNPDDETPNSFLLESGANLSITRTAVSGHSKVNGFNENVYYYGDSVGNVWIGTDCHADGRVEKINQINIPELVNTGASGGVAWQNPMINDWVSDKISITGIAVNPVADLGDFGEAYDGTVGEVVYVSIFDTEDFTHTKTSEVIRTRIFAFGFSDASQGVASAGALQILRSPLSNIAGVAVDDDGSLYFQLIDIVNFAEGGAIFKASTLPQTINRRVIRAIPDGLIANEGTFGLNMKTSIVDKTTGVRLTNYSGTSTLFGNIAAIAVGPDNMLYAAVAQSSDAPAADGLAAGLFTNPQALGPTPSMVIRFTAMTSMTSVWSIASNTGVSGFQIAAIGNGFEIDGSPEIKAAIGATQPELVKTDLQIDYSLYSGLTVDEQNTIYVVSGGAPAKNRASAQSVIWLRPPKLKEKSYNAGNNSYGGSDFKNRSAIRSKNAALKVHSGVFWQASAGKNISGLARGFTHIPERQKNVSLNT